MSAPVARGAQRQLPVIRVDLESPYIEGGVYNVVKWVDRARQSAMYGINIKVVAAMNRVMNAIKETSNVTKGDASMFDYYADAGTLGGKLDLILTKLRELIGTFNLPSTVSLPPLKPYVFDIATAISPAVFTIEVRHEIRGIINQIYDLVFAHTTAKVDVPFIQTLVSQYNTLVEVLVRIQLASAHPTATQFAPPSLVPMALYRPVLLRLP